MTLSAYNAPPEMYVRVNFDFLYLGHHINRFCTFNISNQIHGFDVTSGFSLACPSSTPSER
jgi:hypothetical protein